MVVSIPGITLAKSDSDAPKWEWTADNPKPKWWPYDHLKEEPVRGGYITAAAGRYIGLMNPNHWPVNDWVSMTYLYGGLVYIDGEYKANFPWLAKSWEYLDDATLIMKFRKGIKFHDNTAFNAQSVKYTIDWIKDKKNGAWSRAWVEPVKSTEVLDEYTLKWNFKRPWAGFLGMMATVPGYIISEKALKGDEAIALKKKLEGKIIAAKKKVTKQLKKVEKAEAKGAKALKKAQNKLKKENKKLAAVIKQHEEVSKQAEGAKKVDLYPVGTGRYMFEEGRPGNYLKLKRNPNWWFGQAIGRPEMPYADGYKVVVIPDISIRLANLRAGKIDALGLTPSQFHMLRNDRNLQITGQEGNHLYAFRFNLAKGPCKDIRVRKAISHALDRKALIHGTQFGQGIIASAMFNQRHWCHNPNLKPVKYDPELSKKLLAEAGYANGLTIKGYWSNLPNMMTISNAAKNMLKKVNINWEVEHLDPAAVDDRMKNLEYDLAQGGWAYIKEPDMISNGLYHPDGNWNQGRSNNKAAIKLIEAGLQEMNEEKRQKIYWEIERILYENYEDAWMWYPIINTARRPNLLGYDLDLHKQGGESYWFSRPRYFKGGKR